MWRDFVATLARPFALDALVSTHPISFEVENAKQATERFDVITYWKGAGVVRMIEGFLGADAFRTGVRTYLSRYAERTPPPTTSGASSTRRRAATSRRSPTPGSASPAIRWSCISPARGDGLRIAAPGALLRRPGRERRPPSAGPCPS